MLVDAYGSDDSDNSGDEHTPQSRSSPQQKKSISHSLPPPFRSSGSGSSSSLTLPTPKVKKAPKKIAIDLPALSKDDSADPDSDEARPAKKPRTETRGAGSSALFSKLPAPKLAAPVKAAPERVLGGGKGPGLVFNNPLPQRIQDTSETLPDVKPQAPLEAAEEEQSVSLPFMPTSVRRGKANVSLEVSSSMGTVNAVDPLPPSATDLFSLSTAKASSAPALNSRTITSSLSISSAPNIEEYTPPEPTPTDPYPGYYQLPSGTWAAHDATYYKKFYDKWKADYDREVRALERKEKGFEGADDEDTQEVNALREMERAKKEIQEREEKKALTQGASGEPAAPRMNVKGSKVSKGARKRGQLASLLVEAYQNREALEEKIAEGRRNRKEAGNKYGF
ncbi:mitotic checkpoint regulator, MAD2B-interacting-domain-containing protein [Russula dissimulans]|nr:mitotic checkpoint regulator, MAD2B-interacting-domain-containing protein [Russula dissimulans]